MSSSDDYSDDFETFWEELNNVNLTEAQYLARRLGPKYLPMYVDLPLTVMYVTIFVAGIVGNVITCVVIIKNKSMHTPTDYYLFSLAISDLILLVLGLPHELRTFWQQYPWDLGVGLCKTRAYVSEMSSYVSVLTIVAFSMERYFAICRPLRVYKMSATKAIYSIIAIWLIAVISAIPFAVYTKVNYVEYPPGSGEKSLDSAICAMLSSDMPNFPLYEFSSVGFFLVPMLVIAFFYTRMGLEIHKSAKDMIRTGIGRASAHRDSKRIQGRKTAVKMLGVVVVMFFLCWAPFHVQRLLYVYAQEAPYYRDLNEWLYLLSGCFYYFGTIVNPIVYTVMSARYCDAFKRTVFCCGRVKSSDSSMRKDRTSAKDTHLRRYTIDRIAKMFRFGMGRQVQAKDTRTSTDSGRGNEIIDDNCQHKPLLSAKHPIAGQQSSNESSSLQTGRKTSLSTASSVL